MSEFENTPQEDRPTFEDLPLEIQAMRLRMEIVGLQNRFDEMNALGDAILADREAQTAMACLREMASSMENYETLSHIVMFDKVGIKAAVKDSDWDCVEEHKKSLIKGTELMEKAQKSAAEAHKSLVEHLATCKYLKVENQEDLPAIETACKELLFGSAQERMDSNRRLGAFQEEYNGKVAQYQQIAAKLSEQYAAAPKPEAPTAE